MEHSSKFYLKNGKTFTTLKGLARELMGMTQDVYEHHVNKDKNDFANWAQHSLKKTELSSIMERQINKIELELEVLRHIVHEENKAKATTKKVVKKKAPVKTATQTKKVTKKFPSKKKSKSKK